MDFPCPFWSASSSLCRRSKSQVGNGSRISRLSGGSFHAALLLSLSLAANPLPAGTNLAQRGAMCLRGGSGGGGGGVGVGGVGGGRGGEGGDQVRIGISSTAKQNSDDPVCFRLSSSNALQREWETAKASPTAQDVHDVAMKELPEDAALLLGPVNVSVAGHASSLRRIKETLDHIEEMKAEEAHEEKVLLRQRERCKKWGSTCLIPDEALAELMKQNQTLAEVLRTPRPPGGYPLNTPENEIELLEEAERKSSASNATGADHAKFACVLAWMRGIEGVSGEWDSHDRYRLVPEVLDEAHNLFSKAVQSDGKNVFVRCMYAKFLEIFRGNYTEAEAQYDEAMKIDSNHVATLTFYEWFLIALKNDPEKHKLVQGRLQIMMDKNRLLKRNHEKFIEPMLDGDLRPLYKAIHRGAFDITQGLAPFESYAVPTPTEEELLEKGYPAERAKKEAGGKGFLYDWQCTTEFWNWHGWYKEYWRGPEWFAQRDSGSVPGANHTTFWGRHDLRDDGQGRGKGGGFVIFNGDDGVPFKERPVPDFQAEEEEDEQERAKLIKEWGLEGRWEELCKRNGTEWWEPDSEDMLFDEAHLDKLMNPCND